MMDVKLYVYDLTQGMARAMSRQILGIHIDAVYHTSLVFNNTEYFFGQGVHMCRPGSTHFGAPMEIIDMGSTQLPLDTIGDYLESLKEIYTAESYDLFAHNCNNFSNDFAMFLVGRGIPDHITSLPKRVLDTPFGQMMKPQIDASVRRISHAPIPVQSRPLPRVNGSATRSGSQPNGRASVTSDEVPSPARSAVAYGTVLSLTSLSALDAQLKTASNACATIFFTSATCAPCKMAYPAFGSLAERFPQAMFVRVDVDDAHEVASRYHIRATPTFMTFSRGNKFDEWTGADPRMLTSNVERLVQTTWPPHPHTQIRVPTLQFGSLRPVTYAKIPPLDKLMTKLGSAADQPAIKAMKYFVEHRQKQGAVEAPLPDMNVCSAFMRSAPQELLPEVLFAAYDLLRCTATDPRVSGWYAEDRNGTVASLLDHVNNHKDCPHNLRLVSIHLACNMFVSSLFAKEAFRSSMAATLVQLITSSLLDTSHTATRVAAASLVFNVATANYRFRREEEREALAESEQIELAASLVEALSSEESSEAIKALLLALGYLVYYAPQGGELVDLCKALDAKSTVSTSKHHHAIAKEVASLL